MLPRLRLLGPVEIESALGQSERLSHSAPQRRLLALLAVHRGSVVSSQRLCDLLDLSPGALRTAISRLRASVGGDVLVTAAPGYMVPADVCDATLAERLIDTRDEDSPAGALEHLCTALALWHGPSLAEFADESWAHLEAHRLDGLRIRGEILRAEFLIELGEVSRAIDYLEPFVEEHPLRDRPHRLLMEALHRDGRSSEALRSFHRYRAYLAETTGAEPSIAAQLLEKAIVTGQAPEPHTAGRYRLLRRQVSTETVAVSDWLIGREAELNEIGALLAQTAMLTLTGVAGVGKTRLAYEFANNAAAGFANGASVAELADAEDFASVLTIVASSLGQRCTSTLSELANHVANRECLLVLDNCEHVLNEVADVCRALLDSPGAITLLATSRERVGVAGEWTYRVRPLRDDGSAEAIFTKRARSLGIVITPHDLPLVANICAGLDRLPLAIELAASMTRLLSLKELAKRLDQRPLDVLQNSRRSGNVTRHRTLRSAIDSSYQALDEEQQILFQRISAARGELTLAEAELLAADLPTSAIQLIGALVDHSLLSAETAGKHTTFTMLQTLRAYGLDRLAATVAE